MTPAQTAAAETPTIIKISGPKAGELPGLEVK